jgi:hypothetical protein
MFKNKHIQVKLTNDVPTSTPTFLESLTVKHIADTAKLFAVVVVGVVVVTKVTDAACDIAVHAFTK